ncbi:MAG: glycoside-pentoside-hexuronide (GPH):cation symporter [Coriobacteriia bacterium]|nr:glycoside-pentoside-hexuronide (GPH):cation symporter [Coriobacteriia bacterium]
MAKPGKEPKNTDYEATSGERFTYVLFYFGQLIFYIIIVEFIQLFFTDIGIAAAVVGVILIVTRAWDAINDPIFGVIVDKAKLKRGKYVPWIRIATFLIPVTTILIFCIPAGLALSTKIALAAVTYVLWSMSYTICDVPIYALPTAMTTKVKERNNLYINSKLTAFLGGLLATISIPLLYPVIGWPITIIILGVLAFIVMMPLSFKAKERFHDKSEKSPSLKTLFSYLVHNKYLFVYHGALLLVALSNTASPVQVYVAIHCLGDPSYLSIIGLTAAVPMILAVFVAKGLINRTDKVFIAISCMAGSMLFGVVMYFVGYSSLPALLALIAVRAFFGAMSVVLVAMFTADCAEYGNYKTGKRAQGVTFAIQTFTAKMTGALSGSVCMFLLGILGFVAGEGVVQSAATISSIWVLYTLVPLATGVFAILLLAFGYKLRQKDVAVMIQVNKGELTREEAAALMSRQY